MSDYGCMINLTYERPTKEILEQFLNLSVANIDDNMCRMAAVDASIRPMSKARTMVGVAFTIRVPAGDNLMFHKAMDLAEPGDVVVIDAGGCCQRAIFGELMTTYCKMRGLSGLIVDGCIRDSEAIGDMEFPVYAKGITPNGPYKNGPGEIGTAITVGGQVIHPGDILVGNRDGIVVIRPQDAEELLLATRQTEEKEKKIMDTIIHEGTYFRPWVEEKLAEIGCIIK